MADILIKGMDMPKNCSKCRFWCICNLLNEYKDYESILRDERIGKNGTRHEGCPLVEVKPHGRLIDADKLKQVMDDATENDKDKPFYKMMYSYVIQVLAESPTALEASNVNCKNE